MRKSSNLKVKCRPLLQSEAMEILWTAYPPAACKLGNTRSSRWIRPIVNGTEAWSLLGGLGPLHIFIYHFHLDVDVYIYIHQDEIIH